MKTLVITSKLEFGWNLMAFNPYCRAKAKNYDKVIVACPPDERYIWEFAREFYDIKRPDRSDRWLIKNGRPVKTPKELIRKYPKADFLVPNEENCTGGKRIYRRLGDGSNSRNYCIIHARATEKYGQGDRNYPVKDFERIVENVDCGFVSIGTKEASHHIPGTQDARGYNLEKLCNMISDSKVVIGPSSGPMHIASLCRTPHVVWTYRKKEKAIKGTNRDRYERIWNPLQTPVTVLDKWGWNPPVTVVISTLKSILAPKS